MILRCASVVAVACLGFSIHVGLGWWQENPAAADGGSAGVNQAAVARLASPPLGLPAVDVPEDNRATSAKIALGRKLFFDRRLSVNNTMSCGMCHIPEQGFTNHELSTPVGIHGRSLKRNAPTILNVSYVTRLFLDGREPSLEAQAVVPLFHPDEMGNPNEDALLARIAGLGDYEGQFEAAFGGGPSLLRIAQAVASWERTLLAADSPFDRWYYGRQADALTAEQQDGFQLFVGKGRCHRCHPVEKGHSLFTDQAFHDTGVGYRAHQEARHRSSAIPVELAPGIFVSVERQVVQQVSQERPIDGGRAEVTRDPSDRWRFKTPTLRNVEQTAPYMHDGSMRSLEEVVRYYNAGGVPHAGLDPLIQPLGFEDDDMAAVVAFLRSLTATNLDELIADARSVRVGN